MVAERFPFLSSFPPRTLCARSDAADTRGLGGHVLHGRTGGLIRDAAGAGTGHEPARSQTEDR